jgi:integrase
MFIEAVRKIMRPSPEAENPAAITLDTFFDDRYYPYAKSTKRKPRYDLLTYNKHIRPVLGQLRLCDIGNQHLDDWVRDHLAKGYTAGTTNKHIFLLNRLLNLARHWGVLTAQGSVRLSIRKLPTGDYKQRFASEAELRSLLRECARERHPFLVHFVKLLILTGARSSEARLARWRDFDPAKRIWTVPVSKNGRSRRIVLSTAVLGLLPQIRQRAAVLGLPCGHDDYIFVNPRTRTRYNSFHLAWDRARKAAGLGEVRIHDLRHTYASLLINNGATIYEVQKLLGHHNVSMTERYAHLLPDTLQRRVEIIPAAIGTAV